MDDESFESAMKSLSNRVNKSCENCAKYGWRISWWSVLDMRLHLSFLSACAKAFEEDRAQSAFLSKSQFQHHSQSGNMFKSQKVESIVHGRKTINKLLRFIGFLILFGLTFSENLNSAVMQYVTSMMVTYLIFQNLSQRKNIRELVDQTHLPTATELSTWKRDLRLIEQKLGSLSYLPPTVSPYLAVTVLNIFKSFGYIEHSLVFFVNWTVLLTVGFTSRSTYFHILALFGVAVWYCEIVQTLGEPGTVLFVYNTVTVILLLFF